jgi:hypothetical protein
MTVPLSVVGGIFDILCFGFVVNIPTVYAGSNAGTPMTVAYSYDPSYVASYLGTNPPYFTSVNLVLVNQQKPNFIPAPVALNIPTSSLIGTSGGSVAWLLPVILASDVNYQIQLRGCNCTLRSSDNPVTSTTLIAMSPYFQALQVVPDSHLSISSPTASSVWLTSTNETISWSYSADGVTPTNPPFSTWSTYVYSTDPANAYYYGFPIGAGLDAILQESYTFRVPDAQGASGAGSVTIVPGQYFAYVYGASTADGHTVGITSQTFTVQTNPRGVSGGSSTGSTGASSTSSSSGDSGSSTSSGSVFLPAFDWAYCASVALMFVI